MRIDGFSSAYVSNRSARPDVSAPRVDSIRQAEHHLGQQQSTTTRVGLDSYQAVPRPSAQLQNQHYEARQHLNNPPQQYHASKALASYNDTAGFNQQAEDAAHVLGLDLYA